MESVVFVVVIHVELCVQYFRTGYGVTDCGIDLSLITIDELQCFLSRRYNRIPSKYPVQIHRKKNEKMKKMKELDVCVCVCVCFRGIGKVIDKFLHLESSLKSVTLYKCLREGNQNPYRSRSSIPRQPRTYSTHCSLLS